MPGPYDIYEAQPNPWSPRLVPDLSGIINNPFVMGAAIGTDLFGVPRLARRAAQSASAHGRLFRRDVLRATGGRSRLGFMTPLSSDQVENYVLRGRGMGFERMATRYGRPAAAAMTGARVLSGLSRFVTVFGLLELGGVAAGIFRDAVLSYQPQAYVNKRRMVETGMNFVDTRSAQTQRMAAIQAIHNTQLSTRAILGYEASACHFAL